MANKQTEEQTTKMLKLRTKGMLILLIGVYFFGMFINIFSSEDPAKRTIYATIAFFLHMIGAALLLVGASFLFYAGLKNRSKPWARITIGGFFNVLVTLLAGVATVMLKETASEIASFIMGLGFLGIVFQYGRLFFVLSKETA